MSGRDSRRLWPGHTWIKGLCWRKSPQEPHMRRERSRERYEDMRSRCCCEIEFSGGE
jgi:hypothetical protein